MKIQGYAGDPRDFIDWEMANREQPRMNAYQFDYVRQLKRASQKDCNGVEGGSATRDECGICGGDGSSCTNCALSGQYDDFSWYREGRRLLQGGSSFTLCNGQVPGYECATNYKCVEVTDRSWSNGANAESIGCALCGSKAN